MNDEEVFKKITEIGNSGVTIQGILKVVRGLVDDYADNVSTKDLSALLSIASTHITRSCDILDNVDAFENKKNNENRQGYRGFTIEAKKDFSGRGFYDHGFWIKEGFVVTDTNGCNAMPAAAWFKTVEEAKEGIDDLIISKKYGYDFWDVVKVRKYLKREGVENTSQNSPYLHDYMRDNMVELIYLCERTETLIHDWEILDNNIFRLKHTGKTWLIERTNGYIDFHEDVE